MQIVSLVWGVLAFVGMIIGFIPCLGALNWLNIPFAAIGLAISIVAVSKPAPQGRGPAIVGLACCAAAVLIGALRLTLGMGVV